MGDAEVATHAAERLENVVSEPFALDRGVAPAHRVEHEEPGVGLPAVLQEVSPVAEVLDH